MSKMGVLSAPYGMHAATGYDVRTAETHLEAASRRPRSYPARLALLHLGGHGIFRRLQGHLGSFSSPFRYFSQKGWPIINCCRPNAWFGMALATSSCARTSGTHVSALNQSGLVDWSLALTDLKGGSWPGCPEALPEIESFQMRSLNVSAFM